jgi:hypothetical protein
MSCKQAKKEKEYGKRETEREVINRGPKGKDRRRGWFHGAVRATFSMLARRWWLWREEEKGERDRKREIR